MSKTGSRHISTISVGLKQYVITSTQALSPGKHQVRMEFAYDGGGLAKGGTVTLYIDGKSVGMGRVEQTAPMVFSADETSDVGLKRGSPMTPDIPPKTTIQRNSRCCRGRNNRRKPSIIFLTAKTCSIC